MDTHIVARRLLSSVAWCAALLTIIVLLAMPVNADVPLGSSVTVSGEGAFVYSTDPAGRSGAPDNPLVPWSGFLFGSWTMSPQFTVYSSAYGARGTSPELLGAFGRWSMGDGRLVLDFGRIPVPFGTFGSRSTPFRNPLIDYPLMYGYPVSLRSDALPSSPSDLIIHGTGSGYFPHAFAGGDEGTGMPLIAPYPYDIGASLQLESGQFTLHGALIGGPLSEAQNAFSRLGRTVVGRAEWNPDPAWRVGASYASGPYLEQSVGPTLAPGDSLLHYDQRVLGADLTYSRGAWQVVGEWVRSTWAVPTLGSSLGANSWYLEGRYKIKPGLFVSGRYSQLRFDTIATGSPALPPGLPWDGNVSRLEIGAGLYASKDILLKMELESQHVDRGGPHANVGSFSTSVNARF